jgi:hypothetical protein
MSIIIHIVISNSHHHQPINDPTDGPQAFLIEHPQGEWAITYHWDQRLNVPSETRSF